MFKVVLGSGGFKCARYCPDDYSHKTVYDDGRKVFRLCTAGSPFESGKCPISPAAAGEQYSPCSTPGKDWAIGIGWTIIILAIAIFCTSKFCKD